MVKYFGERDKNELRIRIVLKAKGYSVVTWCDKEKGKEGVQMK